jgi:hypothetical protein
VLGFKRFGGGGGGVEKRGKNKKFLEYFQGGGLEQSKLYINITIKKRANFKDKILCFGKIR